MILTIDGKKITRIEEIAEVLQDRKAGTTVKVVYRRDEKESTGRCRLFAKGEMFSDTDEPQRHDERRVFQTPQRISARDAA